MKKCICMCERVELCTDELGTVICCDCVCTGCFIISVTLLTTNKSLGIKCYITSFI